MRKSNKKNSLLNKIEKFQKNSKNAGITLLALVITIVILLILLGIAIGFIIGSNSLLDKSKFAVDKYNNSINDEDTELSKFSNEIENLQSTREDVQGASNPIGCIISQMGTTAPDGYLACDGTVYDISAYPNLAAYINEQFGSYDYFKIGSETVPEGQFKVPNLQGEFLRGTGANGHSNQGSGPATGTHQDATYHGIWGYNGGNNLFIRLNNLSWHLEYYNQDSTLNNATRWYQYAPASPAYGSESNSAAYYTSHPTTTSVLYCIKY